MESKTFKVRKIYLKYICSFIFLALKFSGSVFFDILNLKKKVKKKFMTEIKKIKLFIFILKKNFTKVKKYVSYKLFKIC